MIISVILGLVLVWGQMLSSTTAQVCISGTIKTVRANGKDFIQYCSSGEWRLHCTDDGLWRKEEADVACRQLGYDRRAGEMAQKAVNPGRAQTGSKFFRFAAQCVGTESSVQECGGVEELDNCDTSGSQHGIAGCEPADCGNEGMEIRLVGGSANTGRVEVCVDGRWETVCNNQEGLAGAVCTHLGLPSCGATSATFIPSTPPRFTCGVQSGTDPLNCTIGSCDRSSSLGVVCLTKTIDMLCGQIKSCETERNHAITEVSTLNNTVQQCTVNTTETEKILNKCNDNITTVNEEVKQCRVDLNVCDANITEINTALLQCLINANETVESLRANETTVRTKLQECLASEVDSSVPSTPITLALGAVIGLLVILLMVGAVGWIVTCIKLSRSWSVPHSKNTAGVRKKESYSLQQALYDEATPTQDNYNSLGPNYNVLNYNQQAPPTVHPEPAHLTPAGASKEDDDFYDVEEHTYAMVNKKVKKKAGGDPTVNETEMPGESLWGVQEGEEGQ